MHPRDMKLCWKYCPVSGSELAAQAVISLGEGLSLNVLWDPDLSGAVQLDGAITWAGERKCLEWWAGPPCPRELLP